MSQYFGYELLFNSVKNCLKEKQDVIVTVLHWFLIRENFQCVGVGTERELLDSDVPSEMMPTGWNDASEVFYLRYFNGELKKIFVLDVTVASPEEVVITLAGDEGVTKGFTINMNDYLGDLDLTTNTRTKIQQLMPGKIDELMYKFQTLYKQFVPDDKPEASQSTSQQQLGTVPPVAVPQPITPTPSGIFIRDPVDPLRDVGRGDLDPFHRGGGMLGIGPQRLPSARYDPVGPIPSHDHFRPPGGIGGIPDPDDLLNLNPNRRGPMGPGRGMFPPPPGPGGASPFDWYG